MFEQLTRTALLSLLIVLGFQSYADASAATTDVPYMVDEDCERRPPEWAWSGETVYVTGFFGWCSAPPGGPASCGRDDLLPEDLSIVRNGCEYQERGSWVLDGTCGDEPRYRYDGSLSTRHSYEVRIGSPIGYLQAGDRVGRCPRARPEDIWVNETSIPRGYPRTHEITVPPDAVSLSVHGGMTYVTITIPDMTRYAPLASTNSFGIDVPGIHTVETLFGDGPIEVTMSVTREHTHLDTEVAGDRRPRRVCQDEDLETVSIRLPSVGYSSPEVSGFGNVVQRDGPCSD